MSGADIRIDESGETWIRIDSQFGSYEYNKTKMDAWEDELRNKPIKLEIIDGDD